MGGGGGSFGNLPTSGYWGGGTPGFGSNAPMQNGNQAQANYINAQGKLPPGMGGTALNQGQQNFFQNKGYLPPGFTGGTNMGFLQPGHGQSGGNTGPGGGWNPTGGPHAGGGGGQPYGDPGGSATGAGGWDISQAFQHLFGGNFGPYTNWMG